ncbi:MAG: purine-binding chemotaxis protein CheW [Gammaproteobacteria bacterium]|nr:purine-binding chemotaxis protein CheW [Gammaproteobacteria bacterium]
MNAKAQLAETTLQAEDGTDQYLTFILDGEDYGVDILQVQEIKGWEGATPVPNMPDFILGIVNLRGTVVPVIDLRRYFRMKSAPFNQTTVVIVVKVNDEEHGQRTMGMVVDAVSEVHNIAQMDLKPSPDFGGAVDTASIKGLATIDEQMIIMLDIDHLMKNGVLQALDDGRI